MADIEQQAAEGFLASPSTQALAAIFRQATGDNNEYASLHATERRVAASVDPLECRTSQHFGSFLLKESVDTKREENLGEKLLPATRLSPSLGGSRREGSQLGTEHDVTEKIGSSAKLQHSIGNPVDDTTRTANTVYSIRRNSRGRLKNFHSNGTAILLLRNNTLRKMEDFVETLHGSDCSTLSTTQENDPVAYEGIQQHLDSEGLSTSHGSDCDRSGQPVPDTGRSFTDNDTGHIDFDFGLQPITFQDVDHIENGEPTRRPSMENDLQDAKNPRTPAQPRFVLNHPGTVMRASQMFLATPSSRGRQVIGPSSDRPTPELYNNRQLENCVSSPLLSPLMQRANRPHLAHLSAFNSPSPLQLSGLRVANAGYVPLCRDLNIQSGSELLHTYRTVKESQEYRMRLANTVEDGSQGSDDGFFDSEADRGRRVKLAKEAAAKQIAAASMPTPNFKNDNVEVPSTSNRRRRSQSEAYISQYYDGGKGGTQDDTTIVDSQSASVVVVEGGCFTPESSGSKLAELTDILSSHPTHCHRCSTSSAITTSTEPNVLPGLEQDANSEATESALKDSDSFTRIKVKRPLSEVSSNVNSNCTPSGQKARPPPVGDGLVPETSPLEPHQHRFTVPENSCTPVTAAEEVNKIENPLTQDDTFNDAVKSPSPQLQLQRRSFKFSKTYQQSSSGATSRSREMMQARHSSVVNPCSAVIAHPIIGETENITSTPPPLKKFSEGATTPSDILPVASAISATSPSVSKNAQITNGHIHATTDDMTHVEETNTSFDVEAAEEGNSRSEPTAAGKLKSSLRDPTLSCNINGSSDVAATVRASSASALDNAEAGALEWKNESLGSSKIFRGSSETLRRLTRKNKSLSNITNPNSASPNSTSRPATRSARQTSVTNSKLKTTESEDPATPTILKRKKSTPSHTTTGDLEFFHNMVFSVSYVSRGEEKARVIRLIKQHGGRLLENGFNELFDFAASSITTPTGSPEPGNEPGSISLTLTPEARNIGFICLIADGHSRKAKYMQALALGLPCVSGRWIDHCVAKGQILDWDPYLLAAGESSFLGGAVHNRNLQPYCATTAKFARYFEERKKLLERKSVLLIMGKGRAEERKKAYLFLTQALGAHRVKRVYNNQEARKALLESESKGESWSLLYVDEKEEVAEKAIFSAGPSRKRKRGSSSTDEADHPTPKKVRIIGDEFVIQSLILGKLVEE